ncbi:MAG: restriction endonuclease, partial [Planctomycetota bacterium]|nr:restriction endonuclease [Planctomycetota bacterium]
CEAFRAGRWKVRPRKAHAFPHLKITDGAFAADTQQQLNRFRTYLAETQLSSETRALLDLACLSVLESISYTRKDGQYLRWDHRAPRNRKGTAFHKGDISTFDQAMQEQLQRMLDDLTSATAGRRRPPHQASVKVLEGSCLDLLPTLPDSQADLVITSPPYCNRYDYTRTYALELAFLGVDEDHLKRLRQTLLSCTVENRSKVEQLRAQYQRRGNRHLLENAWEAFENQAALQEALSRLDALGKEGRLNNNNVPRMVRNYFVESAVVIFELARIVKQGGHVALVNDNVQYGGEEVPVDLILCELARAAGFKTRRIWVLPRGKGNSSQQMGRHGRKELRKCVYLWQR